MGNMLNPDDSTNVDPPLGPPGWNGIPTYAVEGQLPGATVNTTTAISGTEQCPWCWRVWQWWFPLPGNNSVCPRCGQTLSIGAKEFYRQPDLPGYPSD